jgi:hypothetical protein
LKTENLSTLKIHKLTQAQYERELAAGNIDENALYLTPDEEIDLSPYATVEQLNTHNTATDAHADMGWLTSEDETVGTPALINADTLGGHDADYFAKQEDVGTAVLYTGQTLTDEQKTQARENIGVTDGKVVQQSPENELPNIGDELISADGWTLNGWSGNLENGFVNTAGNTGVLTYTMPENTGTNVYIVSFKSSVTLNDTNLSVRIGESELFSLYGQIEGGVTSDVIIIGIQSVVDGNLEFVPDNTFKGTITEISVKRLDGTTLPIQTVADSNNENTLELRTTTENLDNIFIGKTAGQQNVSGRGNVALGSNALQNVTSGFWNTAIGANALKNNTTGSRNVAIGRIALQENICGLRNIAIGTFALNHNKTGDKNIAVGADALDKNENGSFNIGIGAHALYTNNGDYNIGIGEYALTANTSGTYNIALGNSALAANTTGNYNTAIGSKALSKNTTQEQNTAIGYNALYGANGGKQNTGIGAFAGTSTGNFSNCTLIGAHAGSKLTNGGDANTFVGRYAGGSAAEASYNTFIGCGAGSNHTGGYNNILIGQGTQTPTPTTSNYLNIGNLITGSYAPADTYVKVNGGLDLSDIPTTDPAVAGRVWNDNGTLKVSAG